MNYNIVSYHIMTCHTVKLIVVVVCKLCIKLIELLSVMKILQYFTVSLLHIITVNYAKLLQQNHNPTVSTCTLKIAGV